MTIFFTHTHVFKKVGGNYFSSGGLSNKALERYLQHSSKLVVGARVKDVNESEGLSKISNPSIYFKSFSYNLSLIFKVKKEVESSDLTIARLPSVFGIVAVVWCLLLKRKVMVEVVGNGFDALWFYSFKGKIIAPFFHLMVKYCIRKANYVSYITERYLQNVYPTQNFYRGGLANVTIPDENFKNDKVWHKRVDRITQLKNSFKIGIIASIDVPYKNVLKALEILSEVKIPDNKKVCFEIVGGGSKKLIYKFSNLAINENLTVKALGFIPSHKILPWLDNIDIYIQPSKTEAHGRSVIEAMSRGCLIISSDIGGMKETVPHNFRFELNDWGTFKNLILKSISNDSREDLYKYSKINYENSKNFSESVIDSKRIDFFDYVLDDIK